MHAERENKLLKSQLATAQERIQNQRRQLTERRRQIEALAGSAQTQQFQIDPAGLIWIFGTARVGSTWLMRMMGELDPTWNEPLVGKLFGPFVEQNADHRRRGERFILGGGYETRAIREFVLWSVSERFPGVERLVIKEPNGSIGAPYLSAALPESRFIWQVRDPRDVVASGLGAGGPEGWYTKVRARRGLPPEDPDAVVRSRAKRYVQLMRVCRQAYAAHEGPKAMLKYEDLRQDTFRSMEKLYSDLKIEVDEEALRRSVEKHDWENVPEHKKGPGKTMRKATPGGWHEDLTEAQVRVVEQVTAPIMDELGYTKSS